MRKALGIWSLASAVAVVSTVGAPSAHGFSQGYVHSTVSAPAAHSLSTAANCPRDTESNNNNWNPYDLSSASLPRVT